MRKKKTEILPFVHEFVCENDMFICSGDLFDDDDDVVVDVFCAVLLFGLDIFTTVCRRTLRCRCCYCYCLPFQILLRLLFTFGLNFNCAWLFDYFLLLLWLLLLF